MSGAGFGAAVSLASCNRCTELTSTWDGPVGLGSIQTSFNGGYGICRYPAADVLGPA